MEAATTLRRLADDNNHARAAFRYGSFLEHGHGVQAPNEEAAMQYYSRAASQIGRETNEVDEDARAKGKAASFALMRKMHIRQARVGADAASAAAGLDLHNSKFEARARVIVTTPQGDQLTMAEE